MKYLFLNDCHVSTLFIKEMSRIKYRLVTILNE